MTLSHRQGQWKWYKLAEVSVAYKHGRYEMIVCSTYLTFKFLLSKTTRQMDMTDYIYPYVTQMNQK